MIERKAEIPNHLNGQRCDRVAAEMFSEFSRARLQLWIAGGQLLFDGRQLRSKDHVFAGMQVVLKAELEDQEAWAPQDIPIHCIYEDDHLLVIDKPVGLVVHPGAGNRDGTLLNGLLHHVPEVAQVPRAGIVHRIDKDTSGLLVVAKTIEAQHSLVKQLQARSLTREYEAVVEGVITAGGKIEAPIGRHPTQRVKMAVVSSGKPATTHYRVLKRFPGHTHVRVQLETGRTHQIRVHMAHNGFPLVGDATYAGRPRLAKGLSEQLKGCLQGFGRQALHAARLELVHPGTGETQSWESGLPDDMKELLRELHEDQIDRG